MEVFEKLGIKIPNAVVISGAAKIVEDEEVIDFLKQYGSISRLEVVDEPSSTFDGNLIVEFNQGAALATLVPLLPYTYNSSTKKSYHIHSLASIYAKSVGHDKTQSYLTELKQIAKLSGKNYAEVLKDMMTEIGETVTAENGETDSVEGFDQKPSALPPLTGSADALPGTSGTHPKPPFAISPPEVQRYVVEHIVKSDEAPMSMLGSQRLRVFSGRTPRPSHETDYDTWRSSVALIMKDPAISDLQRSRKILDSLLPPAADMVKHLSPDTLPDIYLHQLDSAFGTVQDGDELYAKFMDTFQDAGEKPSAFLQRLQAALNLTVKRGGVRVTEVNRHLLNQFCRGCWDNSLISDLQLKQKKANPPSFAELLLLLRTEEDHEAAKTQRMKQHLGSAKQRVSSHSQIAHCDQGEEKGLLCALTTITQQLAKQMADVQNQLASLTATHLKVKGSLPSKHSHPSSEHSPAAKSSQPKPGYCFRCGEDGHIKPQCDNEPNPALVAAKRKKFSERGQTWQKKTLPPSRNSLN